MRSSITVDEVTLRNQLSTVAILPSTVRPGRPMMAARANKPNTDVSSTSDVKRMVQKPSDLLCGF
uniref:Uncharacterized protein n=1 Tax=Physcomitrium patens TaxID=3218 RepID=A0A2K1KVF9_PHYPA|nr:hypothetical protein PHYPA_004771 [Physcomitrium patens]